VLIALQIDQCSQHLVSKSCTVWPHDHSAIAARIQHTLDRRICVTVKYLANALHTIRFSSVAMIYFNVVKTEQLDTETETETLGYKTETETETQGLKTETETESLKFDFRDVSRPRLESLISTFFVFSLNVANLLPNFL